MISCCNLQMCQTLFHSLFQSDGGSNARRMGLRGGGYLRKRSYSLSESGNDAAPSATSTGQKLAGGPADVKRWKYGHGMQTAFVVP